MRSTKAETERRVEQVYKLLLGGATFPDIREFARDPEQNWNVTDAQIRRYMTVAYQLMRKRFEARADYSFSRHMLRREQLYAHAMGAGDFRTALVVLQDEAKLEGLYPSEDDALKREAEALRKQLSELKEAKGEGGDGNAEKGTGGTGERGEGVPPPGP